MNSVSARPQQFAILAAAAQPAFCHCAGQRKGPLGGAAFARRKGVYIAKRASYRRVMSMPNPAAQSDPAMETARNRASTLAAHITAATKALREGDDVTARARALAALSIDPVNVLAITFLGQLCVKEQDFAGAASVLMKIENPGPAVLLRIANCLSRAGDNTAAEKILKTLVNSQHANPQILMMFSVVTERHHGAAAAIETLRMATEAYPGEAGLWRYRGYLELRTGKAAEARTSLEKSLELAPDQPNVGATLIKALVLCGARQEAAERLRAAMIQWPADSGLQLQFAGLIADSDSAAAEAAFRQILERDRDNRPAVLQYSLFLQKEKKIARAADIMAEYLTRFPLDYEMFYVLAALQFKIRNYDGAVVSLEAVMAVKQDYRHTEDKWGQAHYRSGNILRASQIFKEIKARVKIAPPKSFINQLIQIEKGLGVKSITPIDMLEKGMLPDRRNWTNEQRYKWGRAVNNSINSIFLDDEKRLPEIMRFAEPLDFGAHVPVQPNSAGALIFLIHTGVIALPFCGLIASGLPFQFVTNSMAFGLKYPEGLIDAHARNTNTLLARVQTQLLRGDNVLVALDGMIGARMESFEAEGLTYSLAAGPIFLAYRMRANVRLVVTHFENSRMVTTVTKGPAVAEGQTLKDWQRQWLSIFQGEVMRVLGHGPENYYQKPLTINDGAV